MKPDIRKRRLQLGLTLEDVGKQVGVGKSTVRKWEIGDIENMKRDKIVKLARALKVSPTYIMGMEDAFGIETVAVHSIPVVSKVSAGPPVYAEEDVMDHTYISESLVKPDKEYFGLIVSGDSMDKEFKEGDVVIVEKGSTVENGQIGVVAVNGHNATLKRVKYIKDTVLLMPESSNPEHEPQIYTPDDEVYILGRVVGLNRNY